LSVREGSAQNLDARREASAFIQEMVGDESSPTQEYIQYLYKKAKTELSSETKEILAAVTGAPSAEEFVEAIARLNPDKLTKLRASSSPDFL
jgi:hypothetical protein